MALTPNRSAALGALQGSIPSQFQTQVNQGKGQTDMGLQQAVQQATATGAKTTAGQVQQVGAQQAAQKAQATQGAAGQALSTGLGAQQAQLGEQALGQQGQLQQQKLALDKERDELDLQLSETSHQLKATLIDKEQQIFTDALGRTRFTERQLMDWSVTKARSEADLRKYANKLNQATQLKQQMLKSAHEAIVHELKNRAQLKEQRANDAQTLELAKLKAALEKKMAKEKAKRAGRASMVTGILTVAGAVVGGIYGGPAGASAGAAVGGGVGTAVGQSDAVQRA